MELIKYNKTKQSPNKIRLKTAKELNLITFLSCLPQSKAFSVKEE